MTKLTVIVRNFANVPKTGLDDVAILTDSLPDLFRTKSDRCTLICVNVEQQSLN